MYPPMQVNRAIFHHCQDTGSNCGRTCAQMIISSLVQSPGPNDTFAAPAPATALPVDQETLRTRESEPSDTVATPQWFTHPEEMRALLKTAPELSVPQRQWRLASHTAREPLMADVLFALQRGLPSIIGVYPTDHWVVVTGAFFKANGNLDIVRMLNPLPTRLVAHTYMDLCSDQAYGDGYGPWELFNTELGSYSLEVGAVPSPAGMKSYAGKFVGIIPGATPTKRQRDALIKRIPAKPAVFQYKIAVRDSDALIRELISRTAPLAIRELKRLLQDPSAPVVRVVKDLDGSPSEYTLLSLFSEKLRSGLIGAFHPAGALMHFQFSNEARVHRSLVGDIAEPLWWTRRWLPSLPNPYFPFARKADQNGIVYTRLIDEFGMRPPASRV